MVLFFFSTSDLSPMVRMFILQTPQAFARQAFATSFDIEIFAVLYYFYCRTVELDSLCDDLAVVYACSTPQFKGQQRFVGI
jgi:hypothetical protein